MWEASMTLSLATRQRGPFERARSNVETIANNLYYSLALNNHLIKLRDMPLPTSITIDDLMEFDFVIGNLVAADAIMQKTQRINA
jgi:hypothetical protein